MLGRKEYTQQELDRARADIVAQLAAYEVLSRSVASQPALDVFSPLFFNALLLALDRPFVHRMRLVTGTDGNALNEVELLVDALINTDGVLQPSQAIALDPAESVTGIGYGQPVVLTFEQFERLAAEFFVAIEKKFIIEAAERD